jgi:hypothetical protein
MFRASLDFVISFYGVSNIDYLPWLKDCREIRLLELHSRNSGSLRYVPIDAAPKFLALSYALGDPRPVAPFYVEGKKILLPRSLSQALPRVFHACQGHYQPIFDEWPIVIWIDAICINQKDDVEKAQQVAMMGSIYRRASRVVGYLGEDRADTQVSSAIYSLRLAYRSNDGFDKVPDFRTNKDLASFYQRPWWNRICK